MSLRPASTLVLGAFALVASVLQILATAALGRARLDALARAASEGAGLYLLGAFASLSGLLVAWSLRRRPVVAGFLLFVWQIAVFWPLSRRASQLGLAYHGEYILHHFLAFVSAAIILTVLYTWWRRHEFGRTRLLPVMPGGLAALALLVLHIASEPPLPRLPDAVQQIATGTLLVSVLLALLVCWRHVRKRNMKFVLLIVVSPLFLRMGLAFPEGLMGAPVPAWGRTALMSTIVLAGIGVFVLFRPRLSVGLRIAVVASSAVATAIFYVLYRLGFGELEDDLGGLAQSFFGFPLPYPHYVSETKIFVSMIGLFFIFNVVYAALVSSQERRMGVAMALMCTTGLGLSNPQLALMAGAALFLAIDANVGNDEVVLSSRPSPPVDEILAVTAQTLGLSDPIHLADSKRAVVALRGDVSSTFVDVRARRLPRGDWDLELRIGVIGRGRPDVELVPDASAAGLRPEHELARTHRIRGSARTLEQIGDTVLDALMPFSASRARFWSAGATIELGHDLEALDANRLTRLIARIADSMS